MKEEDYQHVKQECKDFWASPWGRKIIRENLERITNDSSGRLAERNP